MADDWKDVQGADRSTAAGFDAAALAAEDLRGHLEGRGPPRSGGGGGLQRDSGQPALLVGVRAAFCSSGEDSRRQRSPGRRYVRALAISVHRSVRAEGQADDEI